MNYILSIIINEKNINIVNSELTQILFIYKHINDEFKYNLFCFIKQLMIASLQKKFKH